ncbi:hypothetical protein [Halosimplex halobium]|uniref:hypothetical protein n=1 Tax=Halosimplex halobium TaxID=3396618 RepID=UPI003F577FB9
MVEVKSGAIEVNSGLREEVESHGHALDFGSRSHAEDYARQESASDGELRVQAAPENEPRDVDAYLLADRSPSIAEPAEIDGETLAFDVGANLYGALGEAIPIHAPKPHALVYFVREDLDIGDNNLEWGLNVDVEPGRLLPIERGDERRRWTPDCVVEAKAGWSGRMLERYYCEIRTGDASFERAQVATMEELAKEERVLKIRVDIDSLPDQYSLRSHEVEPTEQDE